MLYRKIGEQIQQYFKSNSNKIMVIDGARQIGKSYIIRHFGQKMFENYIEINFVMDKVSNKLFENVKSVNDFYFQLSMIAGEKMNEKANTLVFLDEIQEYPQFLTLLKFLKEDDKFTYIASGSELGVTLKKTTSIPIGSLEIIHMFPLDFEEFLYANGFNKFAIETIKNKFFNKESLDEQTHLKLLDLFKKYLLVGGLPDSVNSYIDNFNIQKVRKIQTEIHDYYGDDASKYDIENKLKIKRIYDVIPSTLENKKKRIVAQNIENINGKTMNSYQDEFDYLISSGIVLDVKALSTPKFPLIQSSGKNLIKLYLNDVGILSSIYYSENVNALLNNENSINLGSVYESVVAQELKAHGHSLFYYDNKKNGEVDFLIDDYDNLTVLPIEVKSGKDYSIHSALNKFISNKDYNVKKGYVLSNEREIKEVNNIIYIPIYNIMFI